MQPAGFPYQSANPHNNMATNEPIRIDFTDPVRVRALEEATEHMARATKLMRDVIGVDNPADNQFMREAQLCVRAGVIWSGDRGGADGYTPDGLEVEIKSTRLIEGKVIQFPTSRLVSQTVIERFRRADVWLYGVFSPNEELLAMYRADAPEVAPIIDRLDDMRRAALAAGKSELNNPKVTLTMLRPHAELAYIDEDYEEFTTPNGRPSIRHKSATSP